MKAKQYDSGYDVVQTANAVRQRVVRAGDAGHQLQ